jgi:hypothetical protein
MIVPDPYAPPQAPIAGVPLQGAPSYKLANAGHVALATFLGSPLAGALVMANNLRHVGKTGPAIVTVFAGLLGTAALCALGFVLPAGAPGMLLPVVSVGVMFGAARITQSEMLHRHRAAGGREASMWLAGGLGLAGLAVVGIGIVGIALAMPPAAVKFGPDQEVTYEDGATEADARAVGDALKEQGFFAAAGGGAAVRVTKSGATYEVGFVVKDGTWNNPAHIDAFREVGKSVRDRTGKRIRVLLLNDWLMTKKTIEL